MKTAVYRRLCDLVYEESGIRLKEGKEAMVASRLAKRIRRIGLEDVVAYLDHIETDDPGELVVLLDLISTNVTHFFRESEHLDFLAARFGEWAAGGQRRFRFWSAASSSGQEPYSMAMVLSEVCERMRLTPDVRILATDISTRVLKHARGGEYGKEAIESLPAQYRSKYMERGSATGGDSWRVVEKLRRTISFKRLNLSQPPFPMRGPLDFVFCRNVMFYFDDPVKLALLNAIADLLRPDGYLAVGKSESIPSIRERFQRVGPALYRKLS